MDGNANNDSLLDHALDMLDEMSEETSSEQQAKNGDSLPDDMLSTGVGDSVEQDEVDPLDDLLGDRAPVVNEDQKTSHQDDFIPGLDDPIPGIDDSVSGIDDPAAGMDDVLSDLDNTIPDVDGAHTVDDLLGPEDEPELSPGDAIDVGDKQPNVDFDDDFPGSQGSAPLDDNDFPGSGELDTHDDQTGADPFDSMIGEGGDPFDRLVGDANGVDVIEDDMPDLPATKNDPVQDASKDDFDGVDIDALLPDTSDKDDGDPLDTWSSGLDSDDGFEDAIIDDEDDASIDDDVAARAFQDLDRDLDGPVEMPGVSEPDDLSNILDDLERRSIPKAPPTEPSFVNETESSPRQDVPRATVKEAAAVEKAGAAVVRETETSLPNAESDNEKPVSAGSQPGKPKMLTVAVVAFFASALAFVGAEFAKPYINKNVGEAEVVYDAQGAVVSLKKDMTALESKLGLMSKAQESTLNDFRSRYDSLFDTQKQLAEEQARFSAISIKLKQELDVYESNMLERFEKVVKLSSQVAQQQVEQSQSIKDAVLREAVAIMDSKAGKDDVQRLTALQKEMRDAQTKIEQLSQTVLAQRQMQSLMEAELNYVKQKQSVPSQPLPAPSVDIPVEKQAETPTVLVEPAKEPRADTSKRNATVLTERVAEESATVEMSVVGVQAKKGGSYDIYLQPLGSDNPHDVKLYWFGPGQSSVVPGYGRVVGVKKLTNSGLLVPYVVLAEHGEIRGKR